MVDHATWCPTDNTPMGAAPERYYDWLDRSEDLAKELQLLDNDVKETT